mmetsp:Transcript_7591/g.15604  ORF Transcript_7591/g.15604 Transcript_7591/m.15604 type:complete len:241 (+) Transcript_7591:332-1054(+)
MSLICSHSWRSPNALRIKMSGPIPHALQLSSMVIIVSSRLMVSLTLNSYISRSDSVLFCASSIARNRLRRPCDFFFSFSRSASMIALALQSFFFSSSILDSMAFALRSAISSFAVSSFIFLSRACCFCFSLATSTLLCSAFQSHVSFSLARDFLSVSIAACVSFIFEVRDRSPITDSINRASNTAGVVMLTSFPRLLSTSFSSPAQFDSHNALMHRFWRFVIVGIPSTATSSVTLSRSES